MSAEKIRKSSLIAFVLAIVTLSISIVIVSGGLGILPPKDLRELGRTITANCFNPWNRTLTSFSLNAVSAVIWDYRGIDTIFETAVLFAAIAGLSMLFKDVKGFTLGRVGGLTLIAKKSVKLVILLTTIASISIAVHGHLTPGGGFQGGSVLAVITSLIVVVYSIETIYRSGISLNIVMKIRYTALLIIMIIAIIPVLYGLAIGVHAYFMQNISKDDSPISMPTNFFDTPLGGSIFFFNLAEYIAIATSLSFVVLLFSMRLKELGLED
jgi:multicomponent Na+:H+ antiporter subunit B